MWVTYPTCFYHQSHFLCKGYGSVIGVSKLCCPTCQHLLSLLRVASGRPFTTRGSHNSVSACTLPTWLPGDIVDRMNMFFGGQLRRELIELITNPNLSRKRAQSTGSQRLSSDSADQPDIIPDPPVTQVVLSQLKSATNRKPETML